MMKEGLCLMCGEAFKFLEFQACEKFIEKIARERRCVCCGEKRTSAGKCPSGLRDQRLWPGVMAFGIE